MTYGQLHALITAILLVGLAVGLFGTPVCNWWASSARCPDCRHAVSAHNQHGCNEYPGDCGCPLPYGRRS